MNNLKIITLNVRGLRDMTKRDALLSWFASEDVDIVALQETHCVSKSELENWLSTSSYSGYGSFLSSRAAGTAILVKKNFPFSVGSAVEDQDGRFVMISFQHNTHSFSVACV